VKTIHLIYVSLLFLFFSRIFQIQIHFSQKEAQKQTQRESVVERRFFKLQS
jgi:hypothetical protein